MLPNSEIKRIARGNLTGNYLPAVTAQLILSVVPGLIMLPFNLLLVNTRSIMQNVLFFVANFIVILLTLVLSVGNFRLHLNFSRMRPASLKDLLYGFQNRPDVYILSYLLLVVYMLPFVIPAAVIYAVSIYFSAVMSMPILLLPGALCYLVLLFLMLIFLLRYSLVYPLLTDDPHQKVRAAFRQSRDLMNGKKMQFFLLSLSFIGWFILGALSFIGILWVIPYYTQSMIVFYQNAKGEAFVPQSSLAHP